MKDTFTYKGISLDYHVDGSGPCVLLLHGFGEDPSVYNTLVGQLEGKYTVVRPVWPGSGGSSLPLYHSVCAPLLSLDTYAELIYQLLFRLKIGNCTILGHSMGGYITLAFAQLYPAKVKGFGLLHSSAFADNEERALKRKKGIEIIRNDGTEKFLKSVVPNLYCKSFREECPGIVNGHFRTAMKISGQTLITYYSAMLARPDRTSILRNAKVPVLFITGKEDAVVPLDDALAQASLAPTTFFHILDRSAHMGMLENPETFNAAVMEFLFQTK